jgi:hypothetical protein
MVFLLARLWGDTGKNESSAKTVMIFMEGKLECYSTVTHSYGRGCYYPLLSKGEVKGNREYPPLF